MANFLCAEKRVMRRYKCIHSKKHISPDPYLDAGGTPKIKRYSDLDR